MPTLITRFAPSPTGPLHLGHAYSALVAEGLAQMGGGQFLLRIEDIDQSRARPVWEAQIYEDLAWLGLRWQRPVMRQSDRHSAYQTGLQTLWDMGLLYPCTCTRADIQNAMSAPQEGAPMFGPDGAIYPGKCRAKHPRSGPLPQEAVLRLDMGLARDFLRAPLRFEETGEAPQSVDFTSEILEQCLGDIVLSRRDMGTSYHLSVVIDDAAQNISHVVRGQDLFEATKIHVVLQQLLGLPTPIYHHHRLIRDEQGKRLAKRDDARALSKFRTDGASPADIRAQLGL